MKVNPLLIPKEFNAQKPANWFSASSDGSNLKLLNWQIWSLSPDGKRALTYTSDNKVALTKLDGTGEIPLDDSLSYFYYATRNWYKTAIWLPNGNVVLLAYEQKQRTKLSVYIVSPDGKLTKMEKPSQIIEKNAQLFFVSPDGENLYWENYTKNSFEFYETKLDDSEQKQILKNVKKAQSFFISPSGQYISYIENHGLTAVGCFIYKVKDGTITKLLLDDGSLAFGFCSGDMTNSHWSPTEDKLFGWTKNGWAIWTATEGKISIIATFQNLNAVDCLSGGKWTPDGKHLFLSVCANKNLDDLRRQRWGVKKNKIFAPIIRPKSN